jgi:2-polyprenyl-6-hydroxyphenyl methylase/3-demethylubiquinone-9 3-methyltransferase
MAPEATTSVDAEEVAGFARMAESWWDAEGSAKPLHRLNPARLQFIRDRLLLHFEGDPASVRPFAGRRLLDIGCGAGLVTEPMARLGFAVTGIDAASEMVRAARAHAATMGLAIEYRAADVETVAAEGTLFDAVLALEIVEQVTDPAAFIAAAASLVKPGGALILSTINRTARGWLLGIVAAEQVLGWVPRGTHSWRRFVRPSEMAAMLRRNTLKPEAVTGLRYEPLLDRWVPTRDLAVNYLMMASLAR